MKSRRAILVAVFVFFAGAIAVVIYQGREPRYQGRALSAWLEDALKQDTTPGGRHMPDLKWQTPSNAVQHIGVDALPLLLKWAAAKDSKPKATIITWINSNHLLHIHFKSAQERQYVACVGFAILKEKAKPAWPVLLQWTSDKEPGRRTTGILCLLYSRTDKATVLPVCVRLLKDPDQSVRHDTAFWFHHYYPQEAEAAGVYQLFPELKNVQTIDIDLRRWLFN